MTTPINPKPGEPWSLPLIVAQLEACGYENQAGILKNNVAFIELKKLADRSEKARVLILHAVSNVLDGCGNSYVNAYTEKWLRTAKELGAYHGPVVGNIVDLQDQLEQWFADNGGLPDLPTSDLRLPTS